MRIFLFPLLLLVSIGSANLTFAQTIPEGVKSVEMVDWNADGRLLAVGYDTGEVEIVDADTGVAISTVNLVDDIADNMRDLAWSPTEPNVLAISVGNSGGQATMLSVVDIGAGSNRFTVPGFFDDIRAINWSPDGRHLAFSTDSGLRDDPRFLKVWNIVSTQEVMTISLLNALTSIDWNSTGNAIVGGGTDGTVTIWGFPDGSVVRTFSGAGNVITDTAWSDDGVWIAAGTEFLDTRLLIWDARSGRLVSEYSNIYATDLDWNPDNLTLALTGRTLVETINTRTEVNTRFPEMPRGSLQDSIEYSPYGGRVAVGGGSTSSNTSVTGEAVMSLVQIANGGVQIIVPDPSLERLRAIAALCGAPSSLITALTSPLAQADAAAVLNTTLDTLLADALPPGCEADLRAVAAAIGAGGQ